ncbi:germination lipoprotein GerS-related protein [Clostridium oceanicum]|uniref:Germination lipoprotein GerS-related protein n=1 Tax=Clostridium oceanicum TaxID=1543 RepID=A0ABP3UJ18_9CLOT
MKKIIIISSIIAIVLSSILFFYFKNNDKNYGESLQYLKNIDNYTCSADIVIKNDKQEIKHKGKQFYDKNLGYRMELNEKRVFLYNDSKIFVKDIGNNIKYDTDKDFDKIYKLTFISEYISLLYTNEEIKVDNVDINDTAYEVIKTIIPGNNRNTSRAELYVSKKEHIPYKLIIFDNKNRQSVNVMYKNFKPNVSQNKDLFNPNKL